MINDDDLLLYYYRELDAADRARIGAAISDDPQLARRLHALVSRLDAAANIPEVPVPAQVQDRWAAALDRAATQTRVAAAPRRFSAPLIWQAAAAAVTVFALVFSIQRVMQNSPGQVVENRLPAPAQGSEKPDSAAYEHGLKFHLASTERRIASLGDATPEERARLVETIIGQNRMYALAAERAGEPQLARVLRAFNPILESLANGGSGTAAADVAQLSFELRVMQARLGAGAASTNTL
jgi:hypothetical protein